MDIRGFFRLVWVFWNIFKLIGIFEKIIDFWGYLERFFFFR